VTFSSTYSESYTITDISWVFDNFAADFDMMAQSTGLRSRENVKDTCEDIRAMAVRGYLQEVNVYLRNADGEIIRAATYEVSTNAGLWTSQRPGNSLWPRTPGGQLNVHVIHGPTWWNLSEAQRQLFRKTLRRNWGIGNLDTSFPMLTSSADRDYVSNGYGLRKTTFK
jgi:Bacterial HORMA domain family 1